MTTLTTRQARIISITSGKGRVGKTSLAVNLAASLSSMGRRTLLADCDFGAANAAAMLGFESPVTIDDVLEGRLSVDEVVSEIEEGLFILPGGSGAGAIPAFGSDARNRLALGLRPFSRMTDFIMIDSPAGISPAAMDVVSTADTVVIVLSEEPTAFMDAYATTKILALDHGCRNFEVITNMVVNDAAGCGLFTRFQDIVARFLPASINLLGNVPADRHMRDAALHGKACALAYPYSPATAAISRIAARISDLDISISPHGNRFLAQEVSHAVR